MALKRGLALGLVLLLASLFFLSVRVVRAAEDGASADDMDVFEEVPSDAQGSSGGGGAGGAGAAGGEAPAAEADAQFMEATDEDVDLKPSPNVKTTVYFPEFPNRKFPIGSDITVLVGFSNTGDHPFNVSFIGTTFHSPFDFNYIIQNFTTRQVDAVVGGGVQQTLEYVFRPDKSLEPLEFWLSGYLIYNNTETNEMFMSTFVNGTVELVERTSDMNVRRVFMYALALAAAGLVGYIAYMATAGSAGSGGRSSGRSSTRGGSAAVERGTDGGAAGGSGSAWAERAYEPAKTSRVIRKRSGNRNKPRKQSAGSAGAAAAAASSPISS
jgi:hypothetical protein